MNYLILGIEFFIASLIANWLTDIIKQHIFKDSENNASE